MLNYITKILAEMLFLLMYYKTELNRWFCMKARNLFSLKICFHSIRKILLLYIRCQKPSTNRIIRNLYSMLFVNITPIKMGMYLNPLLVSAEHSTKWSRYATIMYLGIVFSCLLKTY